MPVRDEDELRMDVLRFHCGGGRMIEKRIDQDRVRTRHDLPGGMSEPGDFGHGK